MNNKTIELIRKSRESANELATTIEYCLWDGSQELILDKMEYRKDLELELYDDLSFNSIEEKCNYLEKELDDTKDILYALISRVVEMENNK